MQVFDKEIERNRIGFWRMMFLMFLGLKIGGVIDWSWWAVFSPLMADFFFVSVTIIGHLLKGREK